jgi:hypothetical protein
MRDADALASGWAESRDAHELVTFIFGHHYVSVECNSQRKRNQKARVGDAPAAKPPMRVNNLSATVVLQPVKRVKKNTAKSNSLGKILT